MNRRRLLQAGMAGGALTALTGPVAGTERPDRILVVVELSGGNDGLNTVIPYADDAYYQARPNIGIPVGAALQLDDAYAMNPGMSGMHRLWQDGDLAIVHGCGYEQPSYSHFTSMAYWHTGAPNRGDAYGWLGRTADAISPQRRDDMLINIAARQSLAVNSAVHTPVVFDDPNRFARHAWLGLSTPTAVQAPRDGNPAAKFLHAVNNSAQVSAARISAAWRDYSTPVDYGIAPMDLPKVAACIKAGMSTPLYHVAFRNNAFDTHVQQPALHRRLLSYASDGVHGFLRDLQRLGLDERVVVLVYSEFGRRVAENANRGTDHGTANVMFLAGSAVRGGHYGMQPSLTALMDGGNLTFTTDFRRVYATVLSQWLGVPANAVLGESFDELPVFGRA